MSYRLAVIDTPTPPWDPPPSRPSLVPAWIGSSLSVMTIAVIVVAGVLGIRASWEQNYRKAADLCAGVEVGPVATVLGIPEPRPEADRDAGQPQDGGQVTSPSSRPISSIRS